MENYTPCSTHLTQKSTFFEKIRGISSLGLGLYFSNKKKFSKKSGAATAPNPRQHLGRTGEAAAARFLASRGYRIVARNVILCFPGVAFAAAEMGSLICVWSLGMLTFLTDKPETPRITVVRLT